MYARNSRAYHGVKKSRLLATSSRKRQKEKCRRRRRCCHLLVKSLYRGGGGTAKGSRREGKKFPGLGNADSEGNTEGKQYQLGGEKRKAKPRLKRTTPGKELRDDRVVESGHTGGNKSPRGCASPSKKKNYQFGGGVHRRQEKKKENSKILLTKRSGDRERGEKPLQNMIASKAVRQLRQDCRLSTKQEHDYRNRAGPQLSTSPYQLR